MTMDADPHAVLRSPGYVKLLVLAAIIGAPIAAAAWGFLWVVDEAQDWLFTDLPDDLGFDSVPTWWPLPLLALAGLLVGLTIRHLPGEGGESPADGFQPGRGAPSPIELPSIFLVANTCIVLDKVAKGIVARGNPHDLRDTSELLFVHNFFTRSSPSVPASQ